METYLVGGAIRNRLLNLPVTERDFVVVGASPAEMTAQGFVPVGKDFPVYLHPKTREEYALARTERKKGRGHTGFECETESVTLEQDLMRRDLTINAIAESQAGELIDPWGGVTDLEHKVLRHVSPAFAEDPLRVLRVARFAALLAQLGFTIDPGTRELMIAIVKAGELEELAPERVFTEMEKALRTASPAVFFKVIEDVGANEILWPQITSSCIATLERMAAHIEDPVFRFAGLLSDLESDEIEALGKRLRLPSKFVDFGKLLASFYATWRDEVRLDATQIVDAIYRADGIRQPDRFLAVNEAAHLLAVSKQEPVAAGLAGKWAHYLALVLGVNSKSVTSDVSGPALGAAIRDKQVEQVASAR